MNKIEEAETKIARALRAMFNEPGSQEDIDARTDYIKFKIEESNDGKKRNNRK